MTDKGLSRVRGLRRRRSAETAGTPAPIRAARPIRILSRATNSSPRSKHRVPPSRGRAGSPAILCSNGGGAFAGLLPLYLKSHSQGEYVFDQGWAEAFEHAGGGYYPKLQAAVPFTPVTGRDSSSPSGKTRRRSRILLHTAASAVKEIGASSLHITFLTEDEWKAAGEARYLLRTDQQFHWENRGYENFDAVPGRTLVIEAQEFAQRARRPYARPESHSIG